MSQIALPIDARDSDAEARVVVGNANRAVVDALGTPKDWPFRTAVLIGPRRSGKTLLGRWFDASEGGDVIDGADAWEEDALFHRWNRSQETGRPLLLIGNAENWDIALPDLESRLGGSLQLRIGTPDDAMVAEMIAAHARQRRLALGVGAAGYLVPRIERSFAAIERLVAEIDRLSLERQVPATMSVWRDALEAIQGPEQARLL